MSHDSARRGCIAPLASRPSSGSNINSRMRDSVELVLTSGFISASSLLTARVIVPPRLGWLDAPSTGAWVTKRPANSAIAKKCFMGYLEAYADTQEDKRETIKDRDLRSSMIHL